VIVILLEAVLLSPVFGVFELAECFFRIKLASPQVAAVKREQTCQYRESFSEPRSDI
jgi:hypothetical protein